MAEVSRELSVSTATLERWLAAALANPDQTRKWTPQARLEALIATAAMTEADLNGWCREHGLYPQELARWREAATEGLADPQERRADVAQTKADRRRIRELERDLLRKDKALAETTALLVLRKKLSAIFPMDAGEDV